MHAFLIVLLHLLIASFFSKIFSPPLNFLSSVLGLGLYINNLTQLSYKYPYYWMIWLDITLSLHSKSQQTLALKMYCAQSFSTYVTSRILLSCAKWCYCVCICIYVTTCVPLQELERRRRAVDAEPRKVELTVTHLPQIFLALSAAHLGFLTRFSMSGSVPPWSRKINWPLAQCAPRGIEHAQYGSWLFGHAVRFARAQLLGATEHAHCWSIKHRGPRSRSVPDVFLGEGPRDSCLGTVSSSSPLPRSSRTTEGTSRRPDSVRHLYARGVLALTELCSR